MPRLKGGDEPSAPLQAENDTHPLIEIALRAIGRLVPLRGHEPSLRHLVLKGQVMNFWDYSILAVIAVAVGFALWRMRKKKKTGCPGCCACCAKDCPMEKKD